MEESVESRIGKKLKNLRKDCGYTQKELADRCGVSRTYLSDIENGKLFPSFKVASLLLETMGYEMVFEKKKSVRVML